MAGLFDPQQSAITDQFLGSDEEAAFYNVFPKAGGSNNFSQWLRGRLNPLFGQYKGNLPNEPTLLFQDFLKRQSPNMEQQFQGMSPGQRGENPGMFSPRVRWLDRR